jgi:hypothetical protein
LTVRIWSRHWQEDLTEGRAQRSFEFHMRLALRKLVPAITAALLLLAILAAPLRAVFCANLGSCQAHSSATDANSDPCHHATVSTDSDDSASALTSSTTCAQPEIPEVVADTDSTQTGRNLDRISPPMSSPFATAASDAIQTCAEDAALCDSGGALTSSGPRLRTTILQI